MSNIKQPIICFGQQPCGFFPKRFLIAKLNTARALQKEIGGEIVFFYHDSDADYRETITIFRDKYTDAEVRLNFLQENKIQKKFSPLYLKRIPSGWKEEILKQLSRFIDYSISLSPPGGDVLKGQRGFEDSTTSPHLASPQRGEEWTQEDSTIKIDSVASALILTPREEESEQKDKDGTLSPPPKKELINITDLFLSTNEKTVADFCLTMYKKMGLFDGIKIVRSSDKNFRQAAPDLLENFFADIEYQEEIVRAKIKASLNLKPIATLHEGGNKFINFEVTRPIEKWQKTPGAAERFSWMNSVINCTHYIYGEGEGNYLQFDNFQEVKFVEREKIADSNFAWLNN